MILAIVLPFPFGLLAGGFIDVLAVVLAVMAKRNVGDVPETHIGVIRDGMRQPVNA